MEMLCSCNPKGFSHQRSQQSCLPKKPLVAICLVVLIAMCVTMSEAVPHRRRHQPKADAQIANTNIISRAKLRNNVYSNASMLIIKRLRNNKRIFNDGLKEYIGTRKVSRSSTGNPDWLPKQNFVEVHQRRMSLDPRQRFKYALPRLYKHAEQWRLIFTFLRDVNVTSYASDITAQMHKRDRFFKSIIVHTQLLLTDLSDIMQKINIPIPTVTANYKELNHHVDGTRLEFQDQYAFRGYSKMIYNWRLELRCVRPKQNQRSLPKMCKLYEKRLNDEMNKRSHNHGKMSSQLSGFKVALSPNT